MRKTILLILFILFTFSSCNQNEKDKVAREGEPDVYNIEISDSKMNDAIKEAKKSINLFYLALTSDNPDYENFILKQKFDTPKGVEHIWIQNITLVDSNYIGTIGNTPIDIIGVNLGDTIIVDKNNISDWMYLDKGIVKGGFTIKTLRNEMKEDERKQFDFNSGLIFD